MPTYTVRGPDGSEYDVTAPEGATEQQVLAYAQEQFSAPQGDVFRHSDGRLTEKGWEREIQEQKSRRRQEVDNTPFMDNMMAGVGRAYHTAGTGLKQFATEKLAERTKSVGGFLDSLGVDGAQKATQEADKFFTKSLQDQQREIDSERYYSQDLMGTGGGIVGNIAGHASQMLLPGSLAKVGNVKSALLPTSIAGNAAQGTILGALQPVATGETRAGNATLGGLGGAAGSALFKGGAATLRGLASLVPAFKRSAQESAVGRAITEMAEDAGAVRSALADWLSGNRNIVPGSNPTTAEASGDRGLWALQQYLGNDTNFATALSRTHEANNAARVGALERAFGGASEESAQALRQQRDLDARRALTGLGEVRGDGGFNPFSGVGGAPQTASSPGVISLQSVDSAIGKLTSRYEKRPAVKSALDFVRSLTKTGVRNAEDAYQIRKTIDDLMGGRIAGDLQQATTARRELQVVKDLLDREMRKAFPGWGDYLKNYKELSREVTQVKTGEELLSRAQAVRDEDGTSRLAAGYVKAAGNLDQLVRNVAKKESGYRRANASVLTEDQRGTVDAVRRDIERQLRTRDGVRAIGSPTVQNAIGGNRVQDAVGGAGLLGMTVVEPSMGLTLGAMNALRKKYGERTAMLLNEAMIDPSLAAEILAKTPPQWRDQVIKEFVDLGGRLGTAGAQTYTNQRPLEVDLIGGRPGPAPTRQEMDELRRKVYGR